MAAGLFAIVGAAGGVAAFRVTGFRLILFCAAFAAARGAALARLLPDGGFSLILVPADAPLPDGPRGVAGANRDAAGGRAFGISSDRMPFRINCGTLLGLPS